MNPKQKVSDDEYQTNQFSMPQKDRNTISNPHIMQIFNNFQQQNTKKLQELKKEVQTRSQLQFKKVKAKNIRDILKANAIKRASVQQQSNIEFETKMKEDYEATIQFRKQCGPLQKDTENSRNDLGKKTLRSSLNVKTRNGYLFSEHDKSRRSTGSMINKSNNISNKPFCRHQYFQNLPQYSKE